MKICEFTIEQANGDPPVTFKIAPTPIVHLAESRQLFSAGAMETAEGWRALIAAVFWGARRAGSQITQQWLEDNVDNHNVAELFKVFREVNQLEQHKANGAGGAPAVTPMSSMTSPVSPPTS